jgi:CP family cyanate transporter-like MFS transporter
MREFWVAAGLLWLAGVALRITILAVPPVITLIQADLGLSGTQIGILSALPTLLFGVAALMGSLLIARFGAVPTLVVGMTIAGIGSSLRGALPDIAVLYGATVLMSAGIAVVQPALPPLVQRWFPKRQGFATAIYTNGLLVGETVPVLLTIPILLPLIDNSWRLSLVIWGLPLILIAAVTLALAPRSTDDPAAPAAGANWWPDWRSKATWQFGLVLASVNSMYFGCNTFLPGHLTAAGRPDLISAALIALNFGQLPSSFLLLAAVHRLERRAWPFVTCGVMMLLCVIGVALTANVWTVVFASLLGFLGAVMFTLGFALPALLSAPADVARMSAAMFTVSYCTAVVVSIVSGAAWDLGGSPRFAFLPIAMIALLLVLVPPTISFQSSPQAARV